MKSANPNNRGKDYLLLAIIASIVFFAPNLLAFIKFNYFSTLLSIKQTASIDVESDKPVNVYAVADGIACCSDDKLGLYSYDGELRYQRQLFGDQIVVRASGEQIVVADLARGEIVKLNDSLEVVHKIGDIGQIVDLVTTSKGDIACQMASDNTIKIYDEKLSEKNAIKVPTDDLIKMSLSADQTTLLVSVVAIEDYAFKSYVLQYDMDGRPIGTSDLEGDLVFKSYLMDHQVIVTQSKIKSYNKESQKVAEVVNMDNIDQSTSHKQFLYTAFLSEEDGVKQPYLSIYSDDLSYNQKLKLAVMPERIVVNDKFIITYAEGVLYVFDHSLRSLKSLDTHRNIDDIQWLDMSHLMTSEQDHIDIYSLQ